MESTFEYKYVIQDPKNSGIKKWEGGSNHKISLTQIQQHFDTPEISESIKRAEEYKFNHNGVNMLYLPFKMNLVILDLWQN